MLGYSRESRGHRARCSAQSVERDVSLFLLKHERFLDELQDDPPRIC